MCRCGLCSVYSSRRLLEDCRLSWRAIGLGFTLANQSTCRHSTNFSRMGSPSALLEWKFLVIECEILAAGTAAAIVAAAANWVFGKSRGAEGSAGVIFLESVLGTQYSRIFLECMQHLLFGYIDLSVSLPFLLCDMVCVIMRTEYITGFHFFFGLANIDQRFFEPIISVTSVENGFDSVSCVIAKSIFCFAPLLMFGRRTPRPSSSLFLYHQERRCREQFELLLHIAVDLLSTKGIGLLTKTRECP